MKRKTRFPDGGATGRFDEDLYERARRFLREQESQEGMPLLSETGEASTNMRINPETGETYSTEAPTRSAGMGFKPAAGSGRAGRGASADAFAPEAPSRAQALRADYAIDERLRQERQKRMQTPGADAVESVYPEAYLAGGAGGVGLKAMHGTAKELAKYPMATLGRAAKEGLETAVKSGPKAGAEVATSTARGAASRAEIQAKRAARQRGEAEAMEKAKPILQSRKDTKPARAARTRRTEEDAGIEFSKGGSTASRRADGCAVRGKTRGKIY